MRVSFPASGLEVAPRDTCRRLPAGHKASSFTALLIALIVNVYTIPLMFTFCQIFLLF